MGHMVTLPVVDYKTRMFHTYNISPFLVSAPSSFCPWPASNTAGGKLSHNNPMSHFHKVSNYTLLQESLGTF